VTIGASGELLLWVYLLGSHLGFVVVLRYFHVQVVAASLLVPETLLPNLERSLSWDAHLLISHAFVDIHLLVLQEDVA
jgi:predicted ATP-grasp superfamily ATP-dependent carboligase